MVLNISKGDEIIHDIVQVVLVNQMTTKTGRGGDGGGELVPALGESWGHASTVRVILQWDRGERRAVLFKSPSMREETVGFAVTLDGIRDSPSSNTAASGHHREKRVRLNADASST